MSMVIAMPPLVPEGMEEAAARAVPMPGLAMLLARARHLQARMAWRQAVLGAIGMPASMTVPDIAIAAAALPGVPAGASLCFVAPLHLVAGMSRVHLPPDGWLRPAAEESLRWVEAFNREFGAPDLRLHAAAGGWLLEAPFAASARDDAPSALVGLPLARTAATDESQRRLRRLGAEAEMWLAAHPLNRERESRRLAPLNALWFWGGGKTVAPQRPLHAPREIHAGGEVEPWIAGLAAACGATLQQAEGWDDVAPSPETMLVLQPRGTGADHWQWLEARWFAPMAATLRAGHLPPLHLQIGASAWRLPDRSPLRWLRRRRPWYEQVAA